MYKKILIATDGTAHSASAIIEAGELARKYGGAIYLLHVLNRIVAIDPLGGSSVVITQQLQESTRKFLDTFKGLAAEDGIMKFETIVRQGELFYRIILDEAFRLQADLIMIGRRESSFIKRVLFQSLTSQLLFYAPCPVLVVPLAALIHWNNILLAVNGEHPSKAALEETIRIAGEHQSRVTAAVKPPRRGAVDDIIRGLRESAARAGVSLDTATLSADAAADDVARLAKERNADMIVTGRPEESLLQHLFQGSFAEQLIDKSFCSVLVVPGANSRAAAGPRNSCATCS